MSNASTNLRRRWFQFSLRTLLILVTLTVGLLVAWSRRTNLFFGTYWFSHLRFFVT